MKRSPVFLLILSTLTVAIQGQRVFTSNHMNLYEMISQENQPVLHTATYPIEDLYAYGNSIFYCTQDGIFEYNLITGQPNTILSGVDVGTFCIDDNGVFYGYNSEDEEIFKYDYRQDSYTGLKKPDESALDMCFCDSDQLLLIRQYSKIYSLKIPELTEKSLSTLSGTELTFNPQDKKIYFDLKTFDAQMKEIENIASFPLDGIPIIDINIAFVAGIRNIYDLSCFDNKVYWLDFRTLDDPGKMLSKDVATGEIDTISKDCAADRILVYDVIAGEKPGRSTASAEQIRIYPNPTSGLIKIEAESSIDHIVEVLSIQGQTVKICRLSGSWLNIGDMADGIYILRLNSKDKRYRVPVIKSTNQ